MPTLTLYPTTVVGGDFTNLSNVLGNTAAYATHAASVGVNLAIFGRFYFQMSSIPADAVISSITASAILRASAVGYRSAYSVDVYGGGVNSRMATNQVALTTTDATYTWSGLHTGNTTAQLRSDTAEWTMTLISNSTGAPTTYWQKFWLDIVYTQPASGNVLFLGSEF